MEFNEIYNVDCLEGMKKIPDGSIDAIYCDPPYFTGMTHGYEKNAQLNDLVICKPFYKMLFAEFNRVAKKNKCCLYWFCDWRSEGFYLNTMQESNIPVKNCLVWDKGGGAGTFYNFVHEFVLFATWNNRFAKKGIGGNVINNIQGFSSNCRIDGGKVHTSQKPLSIIEKFIQDSTQEGEVVLDCFLGSGTTAVAAINTGRKFIGFETDEKYFEIAQKRIAEALQKKSESLF